MAVTLWVPENTLQLPNPNPTFSDTEQLLGTVNLVRTKGGARHTYVKNRDRRRFVWNFTLAPLKAWELRAFMDAYIGRRIKIRDFDGVVWTGVFKSNPAQMTQQTRGNYVDVTIELEASRLTPRYISVSATDSVVVGDSTTVGTKVRISWSSVPSVPQDSPTGFAIFTIGYNKPADDIEIELFSEDGHTVFDVFLATPGITFVGGFNGSSLVRFSGVLSAVNTCLQTLQITCDMLGFQYFTIKATAEYVTTKTVNYECA